MRGMMQAEIKLLEGLAGLQRCGMKNSALYWPFPIPIGRTTEVVPVTWTSQQEAHFHFGDVEVASLSTGTRSTHCLRLLTSFRHND